MLKTSVRLALAACVCTTCLSLGAATRTYQVTGPIEKVTDSAITIQKGKESWEITRESGTKVTGELKPGSKATVFYRMTATEIEAKGAKVGRR